MPRKQGRLSTHVRGLNEDLGEPTETSGYTSP